MIRVVPPEMAPLNRQAEYTWMAPLKQAVQGTAIRYNYGYAKSYELIAHPPRRDIVGGCSRLQ